MSNLITGKEALIALANGEEVQFQEAAKDKWIWMNAKTLTIENILNHTSTYTIHKNPSEVEVNNYSIQFRLKPRTVMINGIEVPAPFDPKEGDVFFSLQPWRELGWSCGIWSRDVESYSQFGAWRTEEEIKQVVEALRSVFNSK